MATGPRPGTTNKAVQINMLDEGFDGALERRGQTRAPFCLLLGWRRGRVCGGVAVRCRPFERPSISNLRTNQQPTNPNPLTPNNNNTQHPPLTGPGGNKGLFTSTNPELRRVVPDDVAGRVKVKVVYTVLEAQYQSALTAGETEFWLRS